MTEQIQPETVISLESAAMEFSKAYSLIVAKTISEKLELLEQNSRLKAYIAKLENELENAKSESKKYISNLEQKSDDRDYPKDY